MVKRKLILINLVLLLLSLLCVLIILIIGYNHNLKVNEYAQELGNKMCEVSVNFADPTLDKDMLYDNYAFLSDIKTNNIIDESKLTYFNGSKCVYDVLNSKLDYLLLQYNLYIKKYLVND